MNAFRVQLAAMLSGHDVKTVRQMRWDGKENGELLGLIGGGLGHNWNVFNLQTLVKDI